MENEVMKTTDVEFESQSNDLPHSSETKNQHPDRIKISAEALSKLSKWNETISTLLRGVKLTRSDLVNFLIMNHDEQLSARELRSLEELFFDEVKFAQWAVEELKAAKLRGESVTLADVINRHRSPKSESQSVRKRRKKLVETSKESPPPTVSTLE